jgi:predicted amidophosphoribosyltransferase
MCGGNITRLLIPLTAIPAVQSASLSGVHANAHNLFCPSCGRVISSDFAWCPKCGTALKAHPCAYCGRNLAAGVEVCASCGAPDRK